MVLNISQLSFKSENIAYWISLIFFCLMCIFFINDIVEKATVLFEYKFYSITTTGILGILSVSTFGWYASKKGRLDANFASHILFSLTFTSVTIILYLSAFTVAKLIFPEI